MKKKKKKKLFTNYHYSIEGNTVIATSTYAGREVKGVARCVPEDDFDEELGKQLAAARCNIKVAKKRMKRATAKYNEAVREIKRASLYLEHMDEYYRNSKVEMLKAIKMEKDLLKTM